MWRSTWVVCVYWPDSRIVCLMISTRFVHVSLNCHCWLAGGDVPCAGSRFRRCLCLFWPFPTQQCTRKHFDWYISVCNLLSCLSFRPSWALVMSAIVCSNCHLACRRSMRIKWSFHWFQESHTHFVHTILDKQKQLIMPMEWIVTTRSLLYIVSTNAKEPNRQLKKLWKDQVKSRRINLYTYTSGHSQVLIRKTGRFPSLDSKCKQITIRDR